MANEQGYLKIDIAQQIMWYACYTVLSNRFPFMSKQDVVRRVNEIVYKKEQQDGKV